MVNDKLTRFTLLILIILAIPNAIAATITSGLYKPSDTTYSSPITTCTFDECAGCIPVETKSCSFNYDFRNNCTEVGWFVARTSPTAIHTAGGPRNVYYCGCRNDPADMGDCPNQYVCNGNNSEYRDYSCSSTGACSIYSVISSQNCRADETDYCLNGLYYHNYWGCSGGDCSDSATPDSPYPLLDDDGDGYDNRCETHGSDPCSVAVLRDNCNNLTTGKGCNACMLGNVTDTDGNRVSGALVQIIGTPYTGISNENGVYAVTPANPGTYTVTASKSSFTPTILQNTEISSSSITIVDFVLGLGPSLCENDCTYTSDSLCHQECWGTNGCSFYNPQAASICNNQLKGFRLQYDATNEIQCCEGSPYIPLKLKATTEINSSNVVRIVREAFYEGKLVKIVIDVFD